MAMTRNEQNVKNDCMIYTTLEELVPKEHLVRKLEQVIDWRFIYPLVEDLYGKKGRPSIDPVVLFKMVMLNYIYGIHSMRRTCEEIKVNIAYRWFLGLSIYDTVPNYSTFSKNYERRYQDSQVFEEIFEHILQKIIDAGLLDVESVFIDATHIKANANKYKAENRVVEIEPKIYQKELNQEIKNDRAQHGKKELKQQAIETTKKKEKNQKVSKVDPESGMFHKGEKEKCFAYTATTGCDAHGFIIATHITAGNIHDSKSFIPFYEHLRTHDIFEKIKAISCDAGYVTPYICKTIFDDKKFPIFPYKRPMTKKGFFKKYEYVYDEMYDCYLCPQDKVLAYSTTNREGYKEYKSNPKDCLTCPLREKCTLSKNHQKVMTRHVWEDYVEEARALRYTKEHKAIYTRRKETIERVFGDAKEKHGLRFTRYRSRKRVTHSVLLTFACMNLKKFALRTHEASVLSSSFSIFRIIHNKKCSTIAGWAFLSTV